MKKNSRFQGGSGCYRCHSCKRMTRETGDGEGDLHAYPVPRPRTVTCSTCGDEETPHNKVKLDPYTRRLVHGACYYGQKETYDAMRAVEAQS